MPFGLEGNLSPSGASLSQRKDPLAMPEKCYVSSLRPTDRYAPNNFADVGKEPHRRLLLVICALSVVCGSANRVVCYSSHLLDVESITFLTLRLLSEYEKLGSDCN
jgi:hypothetical protein